MGSDYAKLILKQVVLEILLPDCHATSRARVVSQLSKRQLKQFQSDTLQVYVLTNPPRLSLLALPKAQDKIYLFADDINVADACAHQFYADALARLQTLEPNAAIINPDESDQITQTEPVLRSPYRVVSLVAKAFAAPPGTESIVDLMDLERKILAKHDPTSFAIFVPEEYPGLVWIDSESAADAGIDKGTPELAPRGRTLVFPSGAIIVHGSKMEEMETSLKMKLPVIQKCMRSVPESIINAFRAYSLDT